MNFFSTIKQKITLRLIREAINQNPRKKAFPVFSEVDKILLLFSEKSDKDIRELITFFEKEGKSVEVWVYSEDASYEEYKTMFFKRFGKKDVLITGIPKKAIVDDFNAKRYDLVIDLTLHDVLPLQYLLALSNATFKVGLKKQFNQNYDFMIDSRRIRSEQKLLEEILFYLIQIHPKQ